MTTPALAFALISILSTHVFASSTSLGVKISTLGVGIEIKNAISDKSTVRLGYFGASVDKSLTESGINYEAEFKAKNVLLAADYHIGASPFRISAGIVKFSDTISLTADISAASIDLGGTPVDISGNISELGGSINIEDTVPYVGVGVSTAPEEEGFGFSLDFGATTAPEISASLSVTCAPSPLIACSIIEGYADTENAQLENEFEGMSKGGYFPVISTGISYRF